MFGVMCVGACSSKQAVIVRAEGEETTEVAPAEEQPAEDNEGWFKKNYETYIVPLLSGVSITSIVTMATTIIFTVVKNKKLDEKVVKITNEANEKYNQAEEKLVEVKEILSEVHQIYELALKSDQLNNEVKNYIEQKTQYMVTVIDQDSERIGKIDDLIKVLTLLTQLETKVAKQSQEVVKSGIIEDIDEIIGIVKRL